MDNRSIASIFQKIADTLEIKGENVFRVRAYRTAAQNIISLARQLSDIYREDPDSLSDIPGIGKDLKGKIIEMVETGHLEYYSLLMKEFAPGFVDMLDLEGLGPKKLKKLRDELGIENVDQLEKACKQGKVAGLPGMGRKTEEKLIASIGHFRKKEGRMLLPEAYEKAEEIVSYLSRSKLFKKMEKAGSLRRGCETVGDLDILAVSKDPGKAMEVFVAYPEAESVIAKGKTKSSIKLFDGTNVDLRIIDEACFGAALVYFTGSREHNVEIRKIAKNKGLKVSEYGVFSSDRKTGRDKFEAGRTEKELYVRLGMQFIPPELRESRGEIEAAIAGKIPRGLVKLSDLKGDLHVHSNETDGNNTPEEVIEKAIELGYEYIAFSDHSKLVKIARGMDEKRLLKHIERLRKIGGRYKKIKILAGVEVDILADGRLDLEDSALKELDVVIASIHSKFSLSREDQTGRILRAMDNRYVNALAHPSGRLISRRSPLEIDFDSVFRKAAENNIAMEINTHGERIDLNDANAMRARELGCRFIVSSDAHSLGQLELMVYGIVTARRAWLEKKDILNTYPYSKLMKALKR